MYPICQFDLSFERVFNNEGAFQNARSDRGNWTSGNVGLGKLKGTKYGISAMSYPELDIKNLTKAQAKAIYKRDWWDKLKMSEFRTPIQYQMFDAALNHGMYNATKILQWAVGVKADGIIGSVTKSHALGMEINDLLMCFLAERLTFMTHVTTWDDYGKGWARRIAHNLKCASQDN